MIIVIDNFVKDRVLLDKIQNDSNFFNDPGEYYWWDGWWNSPTNSVKKELIEYIWSENCPINEIFTIEGFEYWTGIQSSVDDGFNNVSGCAIDSSVRFVQEIEKLLRVDMMNKMNISYREGESINSVKMTIFKAYVKTNKITSKTIVFNNMVSTKQDLKTLWEVPLIKSWHKRFLVS